MTDKPACDIDDITKLEARLQRIMRGEQDIMVSLLANDHPLASLDRVICSLGQHFNDIEQMRASLEEIHRANAHRLNEFTEQIVAANEKLQVEICERKKMEADLLKAKGQAQKADRAKSAFLSQMSHELRSPLNAIIGFADILKSEFYGPHADERYQQYSLSIYSAGNHLLDLIGDILDFSKIEAGGLELETTAFNLEEFLDSVCSIVKRQATEKNIIFTIKHPKYPPLWVEGDPTRIRQILINLADNAVKFTEDGAVYIRVENLGNSGGKVLLKFSVIDTGIGIAKEQQKNLFKPFSQSDSSITRQFGGTGLGLTICKQLVEAMDGEIGIESVSGQGSCFWFSLPLGEAEVPQVSNIAPIRGRASNRLLSVLVVDDIDLNLLVAKAMLEQDGYHVVCVQNGQEALEEVQVQLFDVILMDVNMPKMDGLEATRRIRALPDPAKAYIPIIAMSADATKEQQAEQLRSGMNSCVTKPFKREDLQQALITIIHDRP